MMKPEEKQSLSNDRMKLAHTQNIFIPKRWPRKVLAAGCSGKRAIFGQLIGGLDAAKEWSQVTKGAKLSPGPIRINQRQVQKQG